MHHAMKRTLQMKQTCTNSISLRLRTLKILAITVFLDTLRFPSGSMVMAASDAYSSLLFGAPYSQRETPHRWPKLASLRTGYRCSPRQTQTGCRLRGPPTADSSHVCRYDAVQMLDYENSLWESPAPHSKTIRRSAVATHGRIRV